MAHKRSWTERYSHRQFPPRWDFAASFTTGPQRYHVGISLLDLIWRSNSVWIYPPYVGGSPAGLSYSIDSIGEISYFFP
ncbi:hypothetical protein ACOSP7_003478 [Xanthoceras sorbifolium]